MGLRLGGFGQVADWYQIGAKDGANGHDWNRLASHAKACAKVDITPDRDAWEQGRQAGLQSYCTPANAYRVGSQGSSLKNVCPLELQDQLNRATSYGNSIYRLRRNLENGRKELSTLKISSKNCKRAIIWNLKPKKKRALICCNYLPKSASLKRIWRIMMRS